MKTKAKTRVLIVGSGGNGISVAAFLSMAGIDDYRIITKHDDFGGAWHQNSYPNCATDVKVAVYQFSYARKVDWSSSHAPWNEIATYMRDVARDYGLYDKTDFETQMLEAEWLSDANCWQVVTDKGIYLADYLVPATGFLEEIIVPDIPGRDSFKGRIFHSANWPEGYLAKGDRIAVVGSGCSALQIVPGVQPHASKIYQFQRTPNYIVPLNREFYSEEERKSHTLEQQLVAAKNLTEYHENAWKRGALGQDPSMAEEAAAMALKFMQDSVKDPDLLAKLTPSFQFGCKRIGGSDEYLAAVQKPNVELIAEGVVGVESDGVISASGQKFEVDTIVFATGFLFGGTILNHIERRDGVTVGEYQKGHPRSYKSVTVAGCPNLFLVGGAGPNGQIWNGLAPGEIAGAYIAEAIRYMDDHGIAAMEISEQAELEWKSMADEILSQGATVSGGCSNYSQDATGANKAAWPGTLASMQESLSHFDPSPYVVVAKVLEEQSDR